jgi:hypothetical protein
MSRGDKRKAQFEAGALLKGFEIRLGFWYLNLCHCWQCPEGKLIERNEGLIDRGW